MTDSHLLEAAICGKTDTSLIDIIRTIEKSALEIHLLTLNTQVETARMEKSQEK